MNSNPATEKTMKTTTAGILEGNPRPTRPQIVRALRLAGLLEGPGEAQGSRVLVNGGGNLAEVELLREDDLGAFQKRVAQWGGYRTGYGAWVLRPSYKSKGDPSDPTSAWNY
jgi:hypothetical protein